MIWAMVAGASMGAGVLLLVLQAVRPVPGVAATLQRVDRWRRAEVVRDQGPTRLVDRVRDLLGADLQSRLDERGVALSRTRSDLDVMERNLTRHLGTKILLALMTFIWLPIIWAVLDLGGVSVPFGLAILFAAAMFFLPDVRLHREAEARREEFRHVVGAFLDLVAMNLSGGRGLPEALLAASSIGEHWALTRIRRALDEARIAGLTPWEGLARLGRELGVDELRDLAAALGLAGDEGAKIRASLMSRAASMRRRELVDIEGDAGEKSQSMLLAQLLLVLAFLVFLAYPAISSLGNIYQ